VTALSASGRRTGDETELAYAPPGAPTEEISAQLAFGDTLDRLTQSRGQLAEGSQCRDDGCAERENLREAAYARLLARLDTMPVIEQAKGILMAESRCSPDNAFAMLRAASQRSNVKVRDLAEEIVGRVSGAQSQPAADEPAVAG
jgi:ANTAR domain